jgi:hypothetical protein
MKRIVYALCIALAALAPVTLRSPARAQEPANQATTDAVKTLLSKFVAAINQNNVNLASTMISARADLSFISDGRITRGPNAISARFNQLMGQQGKYQFTLGDLNIANVNGLALATGPYTLRHHGRSGSVVNEGAVTFLVEAQVKKNILGQQEGKKTWVIVHIHRSLSQK